MKTIIKAYHKHSDVLFYHKYEFNGPVCEKTRDKHGNLIAFKNSIGTYEVIGKRVSKEEYDAFIDLLNFKNLDGKEVEIEGIKYKITLIK